MARRAAAAATAMSARPITSICCSPPDSVQPSRRISRPSAGNRSTTPARPKRSSRPPCRQKASTSRFSSTVSVEKMRRPSGTCTSPSRATSSARRPVTSTPSKQKNLAAARHQPRDGVQGGRLARAVGPEEPDDLARADGQIERVDGDGRSILDPQRLDVQHVSTPLPAVRSTASSSGSSQPR